MYQNIAKIFSQHWYYRDHFCEVLKNCINDSKKYIEVLQVILIMAFVKMFYRHSCIHL